MHGNDIETGGPELIPQPPPRPRACHHHDTEATMTPKQKADFAVIKFIAGMVLAVIRRFWIMTGTVLLGIILLYSLYGGWLALLLIIFSLTGTVCIVYEKWENIGFIQNWTLISIFISFTYVLNTNNLQNF